MTNVNEIWLPIEGYEGIYEISSLGNVKSLNRVVIDHSGKPRGISEKILKFNYDKNRYRSVMLCKSGKPIRAKVHHLVCNAFNSKRPSFYNSMVNHIDGDKQNNTPVNLEWCTAKHNVDHAIRNGLFVNKRRVLTKEQCECILLDNRSQWVIANDYNVSQATVSHIKTGKY